LALSEITKDSAIVVAHADDEVLWFSSILGQVNQIHVVYEDYWAQPGIGERRRGALAEYPHRRIRNLGIEEAGTFGLSDFIPESLNELGLALSHRATMQSIRNIVKKSVPFDIGTTRDFHSVATKQRRNFELTASALRQHLRGCANVFTHNPWGEYGHEDHVHVFRIMEMLRDEMGFRLWVSGYCSNRSAELAARYAPYFAGEHRALETNPQLAEQIKELYQRHDCWTWEDDWVWPQHDYLAEAPRVTHQDVRDSLAKPRTGLGFPMHMMPITV
jgi:LmbE family N-acetylglucosaminyl deacetylase